MPGVCCGLRDSCSADIALCDLQHEAVKGCIEGELAGLDSLPTLVDAAAVSKVTALVVIIGVTLRLLRALPSYSICCAQHYKIAPGELKIGTLTDAITSRIATCEC